MRLFEFTEITPDGNELQIILNLDNPPIHSMQPLEYREGTRITLHHQAGLAAYDVTAKMTDILRNLARMEDPAPGYKVHYAPQMRKA